MDILPGNVLGTTAFVLKVLFLAAAGFLVLLSYFEAKEAQKMERKLSIAMPGVVTFAISLQFVVSIIFLAVSAVVFFFF